jgi:hypothetical protein
MSRPQHMMRANFEFASGIAWSRTPKTPSFYAQLSRYITHMRAETCWMLKGGLAVAAGRGYFFTTIRVALYSFFSTGLSPFGRGFNATSLIS